MKECDIVQDLLIGYNDGTLRVCGECKVIVKDTLLTETDIIKIR